MSYLILINEKGTYTTHPKLKFLHIYSTHHSFILPTIEIHPIKK